MEINVKKEENTTVIVLEGSINTNTAPAAIEVFKKEASETDNIILDMSGVSYISSAGVRALRILYVQMYQKKGTLKLTGITESVRSVLDMTGLLDVISLSH